MRARRPGNAGDEELVKWYRAVSLFLRLETEKEADMQAGFQLAKECAHEDAKWLVAAIPDVTLLEDSNDVKEVFLELLEDKGDEPRALFFAALAWGSDWIEREDRELLRRSALLGFALAQSQMARWSAGAERREWAQRAAAQGDPWGAMHLAYEKQSSAPERRAEALRVFQLAASWEVAMAMFMVGLLGHAASDAQRYEWWGKSAVVGCHHAIRSLVTAARKLVSAHNVRGMFGVGAACKGRLDTQFGALFSRLLSLEELNHVQLCVALYDEWTDGARRGALCLIWLGKQLRISKDMRVLIAKKVWALRSVWGDD